MKPVFPTYIIKRRAKAAMRGQFFKALWAAVIPMLVVTVLAAVIFSFMPDVKESFGLALNGHFESYEAREVYLNNVMDICMQCINLLSALFAFLSVGAQRLFLDMLRGEKVKVRSIFRYFNKWHIAIIYPVLTVGITTLIREMLDMLIASGMNAEAVTLLAWVIQIAIYIVVCKLMFVELVLADNDCTSFIDAVKTSWRMVGWNTIVNFIMLMVSFIGWVFLAAFTAGLAFIYLIPYMSISVAALYDENKKLN